MCKASIEAGYVVKSSLHTICLCLCGKVEDMCWEGLRFVETRSDTFLCAGDTIAKHSRAGTCVGAMFCYANAHKSNARQI